MTDATMTYRELLELAAKAAGIKGRYFDYEDDFGRLIGIKDGTKRAWNSVSDSGSALELAAQLNIDIDICDESIDTWVYDPDSLEIIIHIDEPVTGDKMAAIRLAITKAAAELGKLKERA